MTRIVGSNLFHSLKCQLFGLYVFMCFSSLSNTKMKYQTSPEIKERVLVHWGGFAKALLKTDSVSLYSLTADSIYCPIFCESESAFDADETCFNLSKQSFFLKYFNYFPSDSLSSILEDVEKTKILIHPNGNKAEILLSIQEPSNTNPGHQIVFHFQIEKDKLVLVAFDTIP